MFKINNRDVAPTRTMCFQPFASATWSDPYYHQSRRNTKIGFTFPSRSFLFSVNKNESIELSHRYKRDIKIKPSSGTPLPLNFTMLSFFFSFRLEWVFFFFFLLFNFIFFFIIPFLLVFRCTTQEKKIFPLIKLTRALFFFN